MAMYQAKNSGRNAVNFFDPVMQEKVTTHEVLDNDLHHALAQNQLQLHYQLQVDQNKRPVGAEAFVRWLHPERGVIMPGQFLPIAERSDLIIDIGRWIFETACRQLAKWHKDKKKLDLTLTLNISDKQFAHPEFTNDIVNTLKKYRVEPTRLKLELSEKIALTEVTNATDKIMALKNLGIRLSMDNFSAVYSSLSFVKQLSSDQLKIHREFVQGIKGDGNDAQLITTITNLAQTLGLNVFAEGVETEEQLSFLNDNNCNSFQGYLFGEPVAIDDFDHLIEGEGL
jgi:EAL domain-containing protein (putative c-di-GMP-specific phosphodiesterase class I)